MRVLPVDSEHNALFQLLDGRDPADDPHLHADGFGRAVPHLAGRAHRATPRRSRRSPIPTWSMGAKISVDSATLMNKGLELIEAHHLFGLAPEPLDVLVHPQSVVHALSPSATARSHAELGRGRHAAADRLLPALAGARARARPRRSTLPRVGQLTFERPDADRFPALGLAIAGAEAGRRRARPC